MKGRGRKRIEKRGMRKEEEGRRWIDGKVRRRRRWRGRREMRDVGGGGGERE